MLAPVLFTIQLSVHDLNIWAEVQQGNVGLDGLAALYLPLTAYVDWLLYYVMWATAACLVGVAVFVRVAQQKVEKIGYSV